MADPTILLAYQYHDRYKEKNLYNRFFKHDTVTSLLSEWGKHPAFQVTEIGKSFLGKSLHLVKVGDGPVNVFLWSQMHGDEATGTMALFDLFRFLTTDDELNELRKNLLYHCTLYVFPMVNPDGAEFVTRRNAQGIDINRDYSSLQTPEGRLLKQLREEIQPDFGFNLHDQSIQWSADKSGNPATISLMAPPYNDKLDVNPVRKRAMQIVVNNYHVLQSILPDHIGHWNEEYEPRAFGDNFQAAGTSTILIEAGGYQNDYEKQFVRKLFFTTILSGLSQIAKQSYEFVNHEAYYAIPENMKSHVSLLIRNCTVIQQEKQYIIDIALLAQEIINPLDGNLSYTYFIEDLGDLTGKFGYEEINSQQCSLKLTNPLLIDSKAHFDIFGADNQIILSFTNGLLTHKSYI